MNFPSKRTLRKRKVKKLLARHGVDDSMPAVHWQRFSEKRSESMWRFACYYDAAADTIYMNDDFSVFEEAIEHWKRLHPHVESWKIRKIVRMVYGEQMQVRITMVEALADEMRITDGELGRMLSSETLTFCCMGIQPEEALIATKIGGLNG